MSKTSAHRVILDKSTVYKCLKFNLFPVPIEQKCIIRRVVRHMICMLYARHRTVKTSDYFNLSISSAAFLLFFYHFCIRIHNTYTYCIRMTWCIQVILGTCIMNIKYKLYFNCGNDTKHTAGSFRRLSVCDRYTSRQNTHSFFLFIRSVSCSLCVRTRTRICEGLCVCVCVCVCKGNEKNDNRKIRFYYLGRIATSHRSSLYT